MKVIRLRFIKDIKYCYKLIYFLESYCFLSYIFFVYLILFILKKSFIIVLGYDMFDVCNFRVIFYIYDVLS